MDLQQLFTELLVKIGFSEDETIMRWIALQKAYSHKSRHYHNLTHLEEMIFWFEKYKNELQFPHEVLYAIFYHDYVYNSSRKDNELKSAELAVSLLSEHSSVNKDRIYKLIMVTKDHLCTDNNDEKWLIDFDLKILSKEWEDYTVYYKQIRKEYSIYPYFLYNPGRKKALEHFLEHDFIYQTEEFRSLYEQQARINIQKEIDLL
ncbi:HD domain-containing protein [Flavobacterium pedocola]